MVKNAVKANILLDELGCNPLPERSKEEDWDGLISWFLAEVQSNPSLLKNAYVRRWAGLLRIFDGGT